MLNFFLTILIALVGGYIADKKKVPAGFMLGALFAVATFNIIFDNKNVIFHITSVHLFLFFIINF